MFETSKPQISFIINYVQRSKKLHFNSLQHASSQEYNEPKFQLSTNPLIELLKPILAKRMSYEENILVRFVYCYIFAHLIARLTCDCFNSTDQHFACHYVGLLRSFKVIFNQIVLIFCTIFFCTQVKWHIMCKDFFAFASVLGWVALNRFHERKTVAFQTSRKFWLCTSMTFCPKRYVTK